MISLLFFGQDRLAAFQLLATMYIKYIQIFRKMEQCYDQIVHPQKRRVLRHVLDGTMGRILELKHEMVNLEFSEYHYFDDVLSDLKLTPVSGFKKYMCMGLQNHIAVCMKQLFKISLLKESMNSKIN